MADDRSTAGTPTPSKKQNKARPDDGSSIKVASKKDAPKGKPNAPIKLKKTGPKPRQPGDWVSSVISDSMSSQLLEPVAGTCSLTSKQMTRRLRKALLRPRLPR